MQKFIGLEYRELRDTIADVQKKSKELFDKIDEPTKLLLKKNKRDNK